MAGGVNDAAEVLVAGTGQVWFAPVGTTLPALGDDPTAALNAAFVPAGYLTEDGPTLSVGSEVTDFMAWQSRTAIRREKQTQDIQFSFTLQQWNSENIVFAFGGGTVEDEGGGIWSYTFPEADDALDERALVVDAVDGDVNYRFVLPRGNVTEAVESQFTRTATAQLPITFKALQPTTGSIAYANTDAAAFEAKLLVTAKPKAAAPAKGAAARSETSGKPKTLKFEGLTLKIPAEMPAEVLRFIPKGGADPEPWQMLGMLEVALDEQLEDVWAIRPRISQEQLGELLEEVFSVYAVNPGESPASPPSSTNGGNP